MLILLASIAFLLMLLAIGELAGTQLWHGGANRYVDHCATCDAQYRRPAGIARDTCPHGHPMTAVVAEPHSQGSRSVMFIAVCAGFILVALILTAAGIVPPP